MSKYDHNSNEEVSRVKRAGSNRKYLEWPKEGNSGNVIVPYIFKDMRQ